MDTSRKRDGSEGSEEKHWEEDLQKEPILLSSAESLGEAGEGRPEL